LVLFESIVSLTGCDYVVIVTVTVIVVIVMFVISYSNSSAGSGYGSSGGGNVSVFIIVSLTTSNYIVDSTSASAFVPALSSKLARVDALKYIRYKRLISVIVA